MQLQLPIFPSKTKLINSMLGFYKQDEFVYYRLFLLNSVLHIPFYMSRFARYPHQRRTVLRPQREVSL
jgi:hypothetical protein